MEIVKIYNTGLTVDYQTYSNKDNALLVSNYTNTEMDPNVDIIEVSSYGENNEFLDYAIDIKTYKLVPGAINPVNNLTTKIELDPKLDATNLGLNRGRVNLQYNFLKPLFNSAFFAGYWIKEISPSRTELKLSSQYISNDQIRTGFSSFQSYVSSKNYFVDFYLNFGQNRLVIANNAAIVEETEDTYLLIKLYEPLPIEFGIKDTLWICDKVSDSVIYTIDTQVEAEVPLDLDALRGPNWKIKIDDRKGQITPYYNYNTLFSSNLSSSMQQLASYYDDKGIEINVDYTDFSNFVHFSSATERVQNFVYKLGLIEQYQQEITDSQSIMSMGSTTITAVSQSNSLLQKKIDVIIEKFDVYEYYLYYSSESFAWPKSTSTKPYALYSVTSSEAINWLGDEYTTPSGGNISILYSASFYDDTNKDKLTNAIPQYLLDDPNNQPYVTFVDMIGQHFDNVWLYYKDLSNRYSSFNSPNFGISKDVVADALRSFGFNLYTNTSVSDNLYYTLFGMNQDGSLLPPTGSELINNYVTSSIDTLSPKDINAELYKRLYHNLTYLLKTKGTQRGVKALICSYGVPEEILTVHEFGGNSRYTGSGIYEINDNKIKYFTTSSELSNPVLSPYVTLQQYNIDYRLNVPTVEAGFSPSDTINSNFLSSSGFVNMDQLLGNPAHQSLSYYPDLKTVRDNYFASYTYPHSVWEYIRIIKYFNNSLFKTIRDWVPAKAAASTGIIIKSHVLERNKYERHEPTMGFDNNVSQSIDMVTVSGGDAPEIESNTHWSDSLITPLGLVQFSSSQNAEKYTGEFGGSKIAATNGIAFDQSDYGTTASGSVEVDYAANYQNVLLANRSKRFLELDYNSSQNTPVNYGLVTQSINNSINNNYNTYTDPNNPYADIQDYNYATRAFTDARYYGSRTKSLYYSVYTSASNGYEGDHSYGKTAAIDKEKLKYAYLVNVYTSSLFLPRRSDSQIKYLIDNNANTINLTKANTNIFDIQNIYKSGDFGEIALFNYDPSVPETQLLTNNKTLPIYEGGYKYIPMMYSTSSATKQGFFISNPIEINIQGGSTIDPALLDPNNFTITSSISPLFSTTNNITLRYTASSTVGTFPEDIQIGLSLFVNYFAGQPCSDRTVTRTHTMSAGSTQVSGSLNVGCYVVPPRGGAGTYEAPSIVDIDITSITSLSGTGASGGVSTYYITYVTSSQPCIYYLTASNQIVLNSTVSQYHNYGITCDSSLAGYTNTPGVEKIFLPFSPTLGDKVCLYNSQSLGWDERFEYTVLRTSTIGSGTGSRYLITLDRPVNLALFNSGSGTPIDSVLNTPYRTCNYAILKHQPDETNLILRYNPASPITQDGLIYPQYLNLNVKTNSGNVIQALKSNNLI